MAKISIKLASKGNNQFDLSSNHITTTDFGQIQVSQFLPVIPNDKINASLFSEARFAPMVVPTFMDVKLVTRAFYVPMSAIFQGFEYFYTDRKDSSVFKTHPSFTNADLVSYFTNIQNGVARSVGSGMEYDFYVSYTNYVFTDKGRILLKLLHSLGYSINFNVSDTTAMSALPLMAFARVCYDYIYPSQYLDGLGMTSLFKISSSTDYQTWFGSQSSVDGFLNKIADLLTLPYKQDYFTAAWKDLNAPGTSVQSFTRTAPDNSQFVSSQTNVAETSGSQTLSQYGVQMLQRLYEFVTRNNIVGVRYADQLFARFGIGSRQSDPDMSRFIGQHIQPIQVVDVTAMTAAQNQDLGDLAGKAYLQGSGKLFSFDSIDEFGYIICLSFVAPEIGYYQGRKRWTTGLSRFDFVTPEFDMQMRAIRNDEVFADYTNQDDYSNGQSYGGNPSNRFAFAPNYSEFKKGNDYLTGDFRYNSLRRNLDSYHLLRDIPVPSSSNPLALNASFLFMQQHAFDKIFSQVYALRVPITLRNINSTVVGTLFQNLLLVDNRPMVCLVDVSDTSKGGFVFFVNDDELKIIFLSKASFALPPLNIDLDDENTFYKVQGSYSSNVTTYRFYGNQYILKVGSTTVSKAYTGQDGSSATLNQGLTVISLYSVFLTPFQDYIDHIYLRHHFKIDASRPLVPISEEFMIEDGGNRVSVDMNGNRLV